MRGAVLNETGEKKMKCKKIAKLLMASIISFMVFSKVVEAGEKQVEIKGFGKSLIVGEWKVEGSPYSPWRFTEHEKELLVRLMASEAAGEGDEGMYHVAEVVLNRVLSDEFPDTIEEVITQKRPDGLHQFCPLDIGTFYTVEIPEVCYEILSDIETEFYENSGALYFCEKEHSEWHETKEFLFTYKNHRFYR